MAHFHDYNPWAAYIIYIPSISEAIGEEYEAQIFRSYGQKLDAYILPQASGYHSFGIRYGEQPDYYLSPYLAPKKANELIQKYSNTGA